MTGKWKIAQRKHWKSGNEYFQVYRLLDERKQDMGSNREYMGFMFSTKDSAQRAVRYLNKQDSNI